MQGRPAEEEERVHVQARKEKKCPGGLSEGGNTRTKADYHIWKQFPPNNKGTEYSVPVDSV